MSTATKANVGDVFSISLSSQHWDSLANKSEEEYGHMRIKTDHFKAVCKITGIKDKPSVSLEITKVLWRRA